MPKRKGFLYEWMCDKEHIREAIVFGAKDKHDRRDVRPVSYTHLTLPTKA